MNENRPENLSKQEETSDEDLDFAESELSWRRASHVLSEAIEEFCIRFSALETSLNLENLKLSYNEMFLKHVDALVWDDDEEKGGQSSGASGTPVFSEIDLDSSQDSLEIENSGHVAASNGRALSSEELVSDESFGQPQTDEEHKNTNEMK